MPELHVFEYAVVRLVPRVEREEFLNAGVILLCQRLGFLQARLALPETRLHALTDGHANPVELRERLRSFERICWGRPEGGPIGQLGLAERFRWLTAQRSTVVQTSAVHPGLCSDAAQALERLFEQLVA
ncbi:MAG: DUF3037 domain-containing protein [Janthinobacterium lividum]